MKIQTQYHFEEGGDTQWGSDLGRSAGSHSIYILLISNWTFLNRK